MRCKPYVSTFTSMGVYTNIASRVFLPGRTSKNGSLHCPPEVGSLKKSTEAQSNRPLPTLLSAIAQNAGSSRVGSDTANEGGCTGITGHCRSMGHCGSRTLPVFANLPLESCWFALWEGRKADYFVSYLVFPRKPYFAACPLKQRNAVCMTVQG